MIYHTVQYCTRGCCFTVQYTVQLLELYGTFANFEHCTDNLSRLTTVRHTVLNTCTVRAMTFCVPRTEEIHNLPYSIDKYCGIIKLRAGVFKFRSFRFVINARFKNP